MPTTLVCLLALSKLATATTDAPTIGAEGTGIGFAVGAAFAILLLALIGGWAPMFIKGQIGLSYANTLSAGILLSVGLIHILPEATEKLEGLEERTAFPIASLLGGVGFLLVVIVERAAHNLHTHLVARRKKELQSTIKHETETQPAASLSSPTQSDAKLVPEVELVVRGEHDHSHDDGHSHAVSFDSGGCAAIALFMVLSFHSIVEGLGLGAAGDDFSSILIAILAHKACEALALGAALVRSRMSLKARALNIIVFSLMTPIAVIIGAAAVAEGEGNVAGALQSLTAGTFLYVATIEILAVELHTKGDDAIKLCCLVLGFTAMTVIKIWV